MANINQVITIGIGTPSSVKGFLTLGLGIESTITIIEPGTVRLMTVCGEERTISIPAEARVMLAGVDTNEENC